MNECYFCGVNNITLHVSPLTIGCVLLPDFCTYICNAGQLPSVWFITFNAPCKFQETVSKGQFNKETPRYILIQRIPTLHVDGAHLQPSTSFYSKPDWKEIRMYLLQPWATHPAHTGIWMATCNETLR